MQTNLFELPSPAAPLPLTEGIKYAGSKLKLIPHILKCCSELEGVSSIIDGFSGSTRVSQAFAKLGYSVISNDISDWSEVFSKCYLLNTKEASYYQPLIDHLNSLEGEDGWFTENYGGDPESQTNTKKPFQIKNTRRLDAIREEIDNLNLSEQDRAIALTSLILALDSVDNTLGHYAAYLSTWSPRSFKNLKLKVPCIFTSPRKNEVSRSDIFDLIDSTSADLAYLDPPYGSNNEKMPSSRVRYSSYYHIWSTVIKNDRPNLFGKANRREDSRDKVAGSVFEEFRKSPSGRFIALEAIERVIQTINSRYVVLSYSSGGRATKAELYDILSSNGKLNSFLEVDYKKNVMSSMVWTNEWASSQSEHKEYIFVLDKS